MAIWVTPKLSSLPDVGIASPQDGHVLTYDSGTGEWVNEALPAGVTDHGALTGLADDDHTQYLLKTGGTMTGALSLSGSVTASAALPALDWVNNGTVVARIVTNDAGGAGQDDGDLLFYSGLNGTLTERMKITALGQVTVSTLAVDNGAYTYIDSTQSTTNSTLDLTGILGVKMLTNASPARTYAYFNRNGMAYISPRTTATNAIQNILSLDHATAGTPAAGFGAGLMFQLQSSTTAAQDAARISAVWSDATHATRTADIVFSTVVGAAALAEKLRLTGAGILKFSGTMGDSTLTVGTDAPADWIEVQIGADTRYIPVWAAS